MAKPNAHVLEALMSWHADQLERGVDARRLPRVEDLQTIASTPGVTRQVLPDLPLIDPAALMPYASGVLTAVRTALRELAAAEAAALAAPPPVAAPPVAQPPTAPPPVAEPVASPVEDRPTRRRTTSSTRSTATGATADRRPPTTAPTPPAPATIASNTRPSSGASGAFVPYDLSTPAPPFVLQATFKPQADGRLWIGWQPPPEPAPVVLYRVVSRDDVMPWTPDDAEVIGVTREVEVYDARPLPSALRHVQVWAHQGRDEAAARAAQPMLLREGTLVGAPSGVEWMEDHGTVVVSWRRVPGISELELTRVPLEEVARDVHDSSHVLLRDAHATSYQDTGCQPGQTYEYRLYSVLIDPRTGQDLMSEPARYRVQVRASLVPVTEVRVAERVDNGRTLVDLEWDQPANADVRIYRTREPPDVGARLDDLDVSALPAAGLAEADRQRLPPTVHGGIGRMTGVTWPPELARVHFTAVSISGSTARIGDTATRSRTTSITDLRLVQRVTWQHLTFSWPLGAVSVGIHVTPSGTNLEDNPRPAVRTLLEAEYRRDGGTRLQLPWAGCAVHLVPISFYDRRPVLGETTSISYDGLLALRYRFTGPAPQPAGGRFRGAPAAPPTTTTIEVLRLSSGGEGGPASIPVAFTLAAHSSRMPLSVQDAELVIGAMQVPVSTDGPASWLPLGPAADLTSLRGQYLRLFARVEGDVPLDVALLDPALDTLRLT